MVKLSALYGHPQDEAAFEEYYANVHIPKVTKVPNLRRFDLDKIVGTPDGSKPPHYRMAHLFFENMDELQNALATPEGQEAAADLQNFATGGVSLVISEVTSS